MGPAQVVGATVIDGSGRDPSNVVITVENGRITQLGASSAHGERLDAEGLTMTPGLIDAHVHLGLSSPIQPHFSFRISAAEIAADIFATAGATLDAGFTTVRDTGGIDGGVVTAIAKGKVRGPRVLSCGPVQCQIGGHGYYGAAWEPTGLWSSHQSTATLMAAREVALVPTFAVVERLLHDTAGAGLAESIRDRAKGVREQMTRALAVAKHAGVRIGLGSDLIGPAQDRRGGELSLRAALETPMEALVAATRTNAGILGLSGQVGVITPGAQADLVLWNATRSKTRNFSPTPPTPSS
ncbi:amidohydrolase family protein [Streptomyces sp. IB2014 016-6]|uniref:amidohydrolase family protein n=1 Tax=Streptomyces sp. IB2014 016-6 TaxID=2517818 RepID=UPI001F4F82FE|nr:amidohydrolase family protein [Streptomyces sp. IB2014 016-6]